ncbi:hypothetical protein [Pseudomonas sp. CGJS7]|uniref:hypothetical protein n=1 Tax=Pseudomonas sp. CGJS7 TaxID=3109348 RepID=UPI0030080F86
MEAGRMEASRPRSAVAAGLLDPHDPARANGRRLSPGLIVSLALALLLTLLASAHAMLRRDLPAPAPAAPAVGAKVNAHRANAIDRADPFTGQGIVEDLVEFRCVDGIRMRKQASSYTQVGRC